MKFNDYYYQDPLEFVSMVNDMLKEDIEFTSSLDPIFIARLSNYLEKRFPSFGDFNTAIGLELRKYMSGDNNQIKKMQRKIHNVINKAKEKFLHSIEDKCNKIRAVPTDNITDTPPVTIEEPIQNDQLS
jgi:hypothetical protein